MIFVCVMQHCAPLSLLLEQQEEEPERISGREKNEQGD